jgi:hypothetical protein
MIHDNGNKTLIEPHKEIEGSVFIQLAAILVDDSHREEHVLDEDLEVHVVLEIDKTECHQDEPQLTDKRF